MAFSDGQDILNLSLGVARGWAEGTVGVVASRIADQGKVVAIAAGNDVSALVAFLTVAVNHKIFRVLRALGTLHVLELVPMLFP